MEKVFSKVLSVEAPKCFDVINADGRVFRGGRQTWYRNYWQRRAGCGPTTGAALMRYLARRRPGCERLCPYPGDDKDSFLQLMEDIWLYITPGMRGVNTTSIFANGAEKYARDRHVSLRALALDVPPRAADRPAPEQLLEFLLLSFSEDLPVAFLNLSNGACHTLDSWHWVTLCGVDADTMEGTFLDQGAVKKVNLALWLQTTTLGGGFVSLKS